MKPGSMLTDLLEYAGGFHSVGELGAFNKSSVFASIETAIEELRAGRMIVVVDDDGHVDALGLRIAGSSGEHAPVRVTIRARRADGGDMGDSHVRGARVGRARIRVVDLHRKMRDAD